MSQAWPLMIDSFNKQLNADLIPVLRGCIQLEASSTGDQAGIVGAAWLAKFKS